MTTSLQNSSYRIPESKIHGANMGPTSVLSAQDGPHVGPMSLAIRVTPDDLPVAIDILFTTFRLRFNVEFFPLNMATQIAKLMGPTWGPPGSCRPQMGHMMAQWTLPSGESPLKDRQEHPVVMVSVPIVTSQCRSTRALSKSYHGMHQNAGARGLSANHTMWCIAMQVHGASQPIIRYNAYAVCGWKQYGDRCLKPHDATGISE